MPVTESRISFADGSIADYPLEGSEKVRVNIDWWVNWRASTARFAILRRISKTVHSCTIRPSSICSLVCSKFCRLSRAFVGTRASGRYRRYSPHLPRISPRLSVSATITVDWIFSRAISQSVRLHTKDFQDLPGHT